MKTNGFYSIGQRGFTLVEIIITLVLSAILGTILVQLGGTALTKSSSTVLNARDEVAGQAVMEEIVADYVKKINADPDTALALIENRINNGEYGTGTHVAVEEPQYVDFDAAGNIITNPSESDYMKVTVNSGGHTLTTIFAKTRTASDPKEKF
ncbi:PulJ/GspJ family protein [Desulfobacter vibrioformis]|uniref:PulJ/GspJ family protein n=1 Tax=Desulfobacter vibrioformis TaxID=34031 RepID=UPI00054E8325|nr:prepilin-type N-terminal cleavage/methylation domain-containing protein [Desulfobacter vibrioformis]